MPNLTFLGWIDAGQKETPDFGECAFSGVLCAPQQVAIETAKHITGRDKSELVPLVCLGRSSGSPDVILGHIRKAIVENESGDDVLVIVDPSLVESLERLARGGSLFPDLTMRR